MIYLLAEESVGGEVGAASPVEWEQLWEDAVQGSSVIMYDYYPPQNRARRRHWLLLPEGRRPEGNNSQCLLLALFWGG